MDRRNKRSAPGFPSWLLRIFIREEYLEEIQGDLDEIYTSNKTHMSKSRADVFYFLNSLRFMRPENLKYPKLKFFNPMIRNNVINAFRTIRREKIYSSFNLLGLSLGITGLLLSFLFIADEIQFDRFHTNYHSIYRILTVNKETGSANAGTAGPWAPAFGESFPEVESFVRLEPFGKALVKSGETISFESKGVLVDSTFFQVFSIPLIEGNKNTVLRGPNKLVLSEEMAAKYFGSSTGIGNILNVDGTEMMVTGIARKPKMGSDVWFDFYASMESETAFYQSDWVIQNYSSFVVLGNDSDLKALSDKSLNLIRSKVPVGEFDRFAIDFEPLSKIHLYSSATGSEPLIKKVVTIGLIGIMIAIISIINFINLRTARSMKRSREVGVRKALGGQRGQLTLLFLTETLLLTFTAGIIAVLTLVVFLPAFNVFMDKNLSLGLLLDPRWAALLTLLVFVVGLLAGLYPAILMSSLRPVQALHEKVNLKRNQWVRKGLIIFQLAVSGILIIGTWIAIEQMNYIEHRDLGFDKSEIITIALQDRSLTPKMETMADAFKNIPGVSSVSLSANKLGGGEWGIPFRYEGAPDSRPMGNRYMSVDPLYLETMGLELAEGRNFNRDLASDKSSAFLVNEAFVKAAGWEHGAGMRVEMPQRTPEGTTTWTTGEIIGVVKDFNFLSLHQPIAPLVIDYEPLFFSNFFLKVDSENLRSTLNSIQNVWSQFSSLPLDLTFVDQMLDLQYNSDRNLMAGFKIFSGLAIFLATLGLLSLSSYMASTRAREIGMRKVLGATNFQLLSLFNFQYIKLVLISMAVMIYPAWMLGNRYLASYAFKVDISVWLFAGTGLLLLLLVVLTVTLQTAKVVSSNPVKSLRSE